MLFGETIPYRKKTAQTPIPTGGAVNGLAAFVIDNLSSADIMAPGTIFTLRFNDVTGKLYTSEQRLTLDSISRLPSSYTLYGTRSGPKKRDAAQPPKQISQ